MLTLLAAQVADALSLQFRLPPPGVPPPLPRASQDVLGGCPVVDALLLTSVWAVAALRQLAQVRQAADPVIATALSVIGTQSGLPLIQGLCGCEVASTTVGLPIGQLVINR
jgi:hypothetical protein